MEIVFLGTSSMVPTADRNHPAILLNYKAEHILVDCGEGTQRQFRKAKISPAKITKLLITHWHGDHVLGIPGLLQTLIQSNLSAHKSEIEKQLAEAKTQISLVQGDTYNIVGYSDFAAVASGIATLETAVLQIPMVIYYKISAATYFLGKYILNIKTIGLPNIISSKKIVPELINHFATAPEISKTILDYLDSEDKYKTIKQDLSHLKFQLGTTGAYQKTAEFLSNYLNNI